MRDVATLMTTNSPIQNCASATNQEDDINKN
jgi:hypothetical protein